MSDTGRESSIEILIGADNLATIFTGKIECISENLTAIHTKLGWTVLGQTKKVNNYQSQSLLNNVKQCRDLEMFGLSESQSDVDITDNFKDSRVKNEQGRHEVAFSWREEEKPLLQTNFQMVYKKTEINLNLEKDRFRKEYMGLLTEQSGKKDLREVKVGDMVIIGSNGVKRTNWPFGKIVEVIEGEDNVKRVARLKVGGQKSIRPYKRLYPLERPNDDHLTNGKDSLSNFQKNKERITIPSKRKIMRTTPDFSTDCRSLPEKGSKSGRLIKTPVRFLK